VRWQHPARGLLSPGQFIAIAERTGTINALGRWVFTEACRQMRVWCDLGMSPGIMAVNFSASQFKTGDDIEGFVADTMKKCGVEPSAMELELTETVLMEVTEQQNGCLERLRATGVRIALDDFGTGYSSLSYLTNYPVNRLKVAQELMFRVIRDPRNATVVRAAIRLAAELGIECIAEGVQNVEQVKFLIEAGCDFGQGYYYSEPVSAEEMMILLMDRNPRFARGKPRLEIVGN
jgi:EAL domain-containing protein (putative c-di-GMP-specific phosphodiesterase class I)